MHTPKRKLPTRALRVATASLALWGALGCAGHTLQPRADEPHGTLQVRVTHGAGNEELFDDVVTVDGEAIALGNGRGGQLRLRLAPGPHTVWVSSTPLNYGLETYQHEEPDGPCVDPACFTRSTQTRTDVGLKPRPRPPCKEGFDVAIAAGATTEVAYDSSAPGECAASDAEQ